MQNLTGTQLKELAAKRILVLDGAMGTMIQSYGLQEDDFRGLILADHPVDMKGNNDILCLTRPDIISEIHHDYFLAGADIVTTNTFNGTSIAQSDYQTSYLVRDINVAAARLARQEADRFTALNPEQPRFVAGSLAPTNRTCSISPDVNNPGHRNITFSELVQAYAEEAEALLDGGVDLLVVETVFDPLNAKAAVFAIDKVLEKRGLLDFPVWISGTITDASGRTLTGQTPEAFWISLSHANPSIFGLNCALGATAMRPFIEEISQVANTLVSAHPNAGLPNELGGYDETPDQMAAIMADFASAGLLNIVGGCCGTIPAHIKAIAQAVEGVAPRIVPAKRAGTFLAGLEPLVMDDNSLFVNVGERTNVAGSRKFARLIRDEKLEEALEVGRQQVRGGAQIVDVNMDDAMLDAKESMCRFLNVLASDPEVSRVPVMIDSSDWEVLEAGLQRIQGKGVVNSISLKDGEDEFRRRARLVRRYGAAAIVMAFDEKGQADSLARRLEIIDRAWQILVEEEHFPAEDIIFDPNVFAVATGLPEHDNYAVDFIACCRHIKKNMKGAQISGGISNLSFSFRGNDTVREAMHAVFLYHAIQAGLSLGIVNAGQLAVYQEIRPELLSAVEDVVLNKNPEATDQLLALAQETAGKKSIRSEDLSWREKPAKERLIHALLTGEADYVQEDTLAALEDAGSPISVIEGDLMAGLNQVGDLFGAGKMFLPQVIRSARVMKKAVTVLEPFLAAEKDGTVVSAGKILLATVKGDVHDIGKNIVGVVLGCNNYEIIDLGVMVPVEKIIETAIDEKVDAIGLSGLITPSLAEMVHVAEEMERAGLTIPLLIGGATTSRVHTAVKLDPSYRSGVFYVQDASRAVSMVSSLFNTETRQGVLDFTHEEYSSVRSARETAQQKKQLLSLKSSRDNSCSLDWSEYDPPAPNTSGRHLVEKVSLATLRPYIDWTPFFRTWRLPGSYPGILTEPKTGSEATRLMAEAGTMLDKMISDEQIEAKAVWGIFPAQRDGDDVILFTDETCSDELRRIPFLRQQRSSQAGRPNYCLADFIAPANTDKMDWLGCFVVTAGLGVEKLARQYESEGDDFHSIMVKALADRLAEAFAEYLHHKVRTRHWGYAPQEKLDNEALIGEEYQGIRPAPGYPACPDHLAKEWIFELLAAEKQTGVTLTESFAMDPGATVAGWYFSHPEARYFGLGRIAEDQVLDYAQRAGISFADAQRWLAANLG